MDLEEAQEYLNKLRSNSTTPPQYANLAKIITDIPECRAEAFEVLQEALESEKNDYWSLREAYKALASIAEAHPNHLPQVLEFCKTALESEENNGSSLAKLYESLATIVKIAQPEQIPQALELFKRVLESEENDGDSLSASYESLAPIAKVAHAEQIPQILEFFKTALKSEKNYKYSLKNAYHSLASIAEAHPEYVPEILDLYKQALASQGNDDDSLDMACRSLAPIAKVAQAEQTPQVLELFKTAVESETGKSYLLERTYKSLAEVAIAHPEHLSQSLELFKLISTSKGNDNRSLAALYDALAEVAIAHPEHLPQILELYKQVLTSKNKDIAVHSSCGTSLARITDTYPKGIPQILDFCNTFENDGSDLLLAYISSVSLDNITQPEHISKILDLYKPVLTSQEYDEDLLYRVYYSLDSVTQSHPGYMSQILELYNIGLASEKNTAGSVIIAYKTLDTIAKAYPEYTSKVLDLYNLGLSQTNDRWSLPEVCESLASIAKAHPEHISKILDLYKQALSSPGNDENSSSVVYGYLNAIAEDHPEYTLQILNLYKKEGIAFAKNDKYSLSSAYKGLASFATAHPEQMQQILMFLTTQKSDTSLSARYSILNNVAIAHPEYVPQILEAYKIALSSEQNRWDLLRYAYKSLGSIAEAHPEYVPQILKVFETALESEKNDGYSLEEVYKSLASVAKVSQPEQISQVLEVFKTALESKKDKDFSLKEAYKSLAEVAKSHPKHLPQVLDVYKIALASDQNDDSLKKEAFGYLADIVQKEPAYASEVLKFLPPEEEEARLKIYYAYLQKNRLTPEEVPEHDQAIFQAALKIRRSMPAEAKYFIENMAPKQIAEYNFSAQQRAMNVLLGMAAKEQGIPAEESAQFRKQPSEKVQKLLENEKDWLLPASMKSAEVFGCWLPNYLKKTQGYLSVHDAVYWLPENLSPEKNESFSLFLRNNIVYTDDQAQTKARPLNELDIIARNWKSLRPEEEKQSYKDVLAVCQSKKYENQKYDHFAVEAAKFGYHEEDYPTMEKIYGAGLDVPEPFDSTKEFKLGKYTGKFLPREDPRVGFFGNYTDCCQHFNGAGHTCAVSSIKDPYSQLFVVEDEEGRIIAGSWVWENTEGKYREACFDNIEAIGEYSKNPLINKIYEHVGSYLCQEENCRRVTIGTGYQDADVSKYAETEKISLPLHYHEAYSDAKGTQLLLAENKKAKPLDKTQESLRFTRTVCPLDYEEMDKVSEKCFPEGDQALQAPENLSGKVLVDEHKGVVGYCLYDEAEKHIYDMAVLPEYRKDKNASSRRLIGAVMKEIKALGGEWTLEARDKTSLRLLEAMEQRGMVKLDKGDVDHVMSDGSKVYECRFKVLPREERQTQMTRDNGHDGR